MTAALRQGTRRALADGALLGLFMFAANAATLWLEHPEFGLSSRIPDGAHRRAIMGAAMGLVAIGLIRSPLGAFSGAHLNPAVTATFWRLGRIPGKLAALYAVAQCAGAAAGVGLARFALGPRLADAEVRFAATLPGDSGLVAAIAGEWVIATLMMGTVLLLGGSRFARATPLAAGLWLFVFILVEAPLSGMSLNPARSLGSALWAGRFDAFWIYVVAPPAAMLSTARLLRSLGLLPRAIPATLCPDGSIPAPGCGCAPAGGTTP